MASSAVEECDFNVFVGAETGLLKGVSINPKANLAKNFHNLKSGLSKEEEITCMSWNQEDGKEILLGLRNRTVKVFDTSEKMFVECFDVSSCEEGEENFGALRGVARVDGAILTAVESGLVKLWRHEKKERVTFNTIDVEVEGSGKLKRDDFASEEDRLKHLATIKAGRSLCRMRTSPADPSVLATGGKENDLQLWDLNRPADGPIFRAKNVKPNFLELRVPVWVSDLCFPDAQSSALLATATRYGHVRLYDTRAEMRRPAMELEFPEQTLTAMSATPNKDQVLVATASGQMALFDFRQRHKGMFRKYKGCVGSVRSLDCSRESGYFASVGLDRFVRIYNVNSKKIVQKMYLKSRLNCVLLGQGFDPNATEQERVEKAATKTTDEDSDIEIIKSEDEDEEEDALWNNMKVVGAAEEKKMADKKEIAEVATQKRSLEMALKPIVRGKKKRKVKGDK